MAEGLIVGFDLLKDDCRLSYFEEGEEEPKDFAFSDSEHPYIVQNSICKKKGEDKWLIGEAAYQTTLFGDGTIVDKLLKIVSLDGTATIENVTYSAEDLLTFFIREVLAGLFREKRTKAIQQMVITVQEMDAKVIDVLLRSLKRLGIDKKIVHVVSHTECFLYYVLSQRSNLWSNLTALYDLSGDGLNYYEMQIVRGISPNIANATRTFLEEGFSADILKTPTGQRMGDNILKNCVDRMMEKKVVSAVFLSGVGMDQCQTWGNGFLKSLCNRRKVFYIENIFAKGAVFKAVDELRDASAYPYSLMCEGRINVAISMEVYKGVNKQTLPLTTIGKNWYESVSNFDIFLEDEDTIRLKVQKLGERYPIDITIPVFHLNGRENKAVRCNFSLAFTNDKSFTVQLKDKGFGELIPSQNEVITKTFTIG